MLLLALFWLNKVCAAFWRRIEMISKCEKCNIGVLSFVSHFRWCPIFVGVPFSLKKGHQRKMGHQRKFLIFSIVFLGHQRKKGYQRKMGHQWKWDTNENGTPTKIFYVVSVISWVDIWFFFTYLAGTVSVELCRSLQKKF